MTTLVGFLALTAIPVAAVMLMITIIGIPIALLALVLYAALLMIGYVWLAVVLGGLLLDRSRRDSEGRPETPVSCVVLPLHDLSEQRASRSRMDAKHWN